MMYFSNLYSFRVWLLINVILRDIRKVHSCVITILKFGWTRYVHSRSDTITNSSQNTQYQLLFSVFATCDIIFWPNFLGSERCWWIVLQEKTNSRVRDERIRAASAFGWHLIAEYTEYPVGRVSTVGREYPFALYKWSVVSMPHRSRLDSHG